MNEVGIDVSDLFLINRLGSDGTQKGSSCLYCTPNVVWEIVPSHKSATKLRNASNREIKPIDDRKQLYSQCDPF